MTLMKSLTSLPKRGWKRANFTVYSNTSSLPSMTARPTAAFMHSLHPNHSLVVSYIINLSVYRLLLT
jgi:hypothetical protein